MNALSRKMLGYAQSPFPVSFDGSGLLYGAALFVLIVISCLAVMIGSAHLKRLWSDRHQGMTLVWAFRTFVTAVCLGILFRIPADIVYMLAYADAEADTLQTIMTVKRVLDVLCFAPGCLWMAIVFLYGPDIEFAVKYPAGKMWTDHRLHRLKRFTTIICLSAAFAATVTLGRLFA